MNKKVGLWINRNKAVIVSIADNVEAKSIITSDMEHYVLYSTVVPGDGSPENLRDRRFWNHLGEYYDKILAHIRAPQRSRFLDQQWRSTSFKSAWRMKGCGTM